LVTIATSTATFAYWLVFAGNKATGALEGVMESKSEQGDIWLIRSVTIVIFLMVVFKCAELAAPQDWEEQILNFVKLFCIFFIWDVAMLFFLAPGTETRKEIFRGMLGFNLPTIIAGLGIMYIVPAAWNYYDLWTPIYRTEAREYVKPDIFLSGLLSFHLVFSGIGYILLQTFHKDARGANHA
jgi:hypothetical protein